MQTGPKTADWVFFWIVAGARFLLPLTIPRYPLPGIVASLLFVAMAFAAIHFGMVDIGFVSKSGKTVEPMDVFWAVVIGLGGVIPAGTLVRLICLATRMVSVFACA